ncbi:MAG: AAA family ATPase [Nocardioides sp.]
MPRLIHLDGPPGVGKSTLARRYGADHPGVLVCEIDLVRTMVARWEDDPVDAGERIRTAALALIGAYLADGGDVVLPQLMANPVQVARFAATAEAAGATYHRLVLTAPIDEVVRRFRGRGDDHPWARRAREVVDADGGDAALARWADRLAGSGAETLPSTTPDETYAALLAALPGEVSCPDS